MGREPEYNYLIPSQPSANRNVQHTTAVTARPFNGSRRQAQASDTQACGRRPPGFNDGIAECVKPERHVVGTRLGSTANARNALRW